MQWIQARVIFEHSDPRLAEELISDIFYGMALQGVVVESPDPEPSEPNRYGEWWDETLQRPDRHAVIGYISRTPGADQKIETLESELARLKADHGIEARPVYETVDEEDWAEAWKEYFWPLKVGRRVVVKPTWREYAPEPEDLVLEIDPGMAFGTGTHPTTALCIQMLEAHLAPGMSLLDVGTGSGILMIAARKLGAGRIFGVDTDPVAVTVAEKNLRLNGISDFDLAAGSLSGVQGRFDLVAANILSEVILALLPDIHRVLGPKGIFIGSGIIQENGDAVIAGMKALDFEILEVRAREGWVAIVGRRGP